MKQLFKPQLKMEQFIFKLELSSAERARRKGSCTGTMPSTAQGRRPSPLEPHGQVLHEGGLFSSSTAPSGCRAHASTSQGPPKVCRLHCSPCPILAAAPCRHRPQPQQPQSPLTGPRPDAATPGPRHSYKKEEDLGCKPMPRLSPHSASRAQLLPSKRAVSVASWSTPGPGTAGAFQGGISTTVLIS